MARYNSLRRSIPKSVFEDQYPNLYNIVREKSAIVASVFNSRPLNISFRRNLVAENLQS
jgi:hypothetical protein